MTMKSWQAKKNDEEIYDNGSIESHVGNIHSITASTYCFSLCTSSYMIVPLERGVIIM